MKNNKHGFTTKALHTPFPVPDTHDALHMPVYDGVAYEFDSAEIMEDVFTHKVKSHIYSRTSNPTVEYFEQKMLAVTGGFAAIAVSSGMAAISNAILAVIEKGENILASNHLFGHTYALFKYTLPSWGISVKWININSVDDIVSAIDNNTRAIFFETITNPQLEIPDIPAITELAKKYNLITIADSTLTPPCVFNSKQHGIDIDVMSATKFISGGATAFGGVIIDNGRDWSKTPALKRFADAGEKALVFKIRKEIFRHLGGSMTAQTAHYMNLGLDILAIRVERSVKNSFKLAEFLAGHPAVKNVIYPGLDTHPQNRLAKELFSNKPGAILTFGLKNIDECFRFMNNLQMIRRATNLNDNKTLIIHPDSTIYAEFSPEEKKNMQIKDTMMRLSVGIEDTEDLISDIESALNNI
ncbi:MAG: O-acetylhomoserine aminocarboxypropyltransferase/cysteine synthase [Chlorobi bacterium]|nr:O-acetylhomoserine aminocarboxypropyltransferase/cysteine synthase [Chlorobiota bacterium]